jgi:PAS domain S-box-containing protein
MMQAEHTHSNWKEFLDRLPAAIFKHRLLADGQAQIERVSPDCRLIWEVDSQEILRDPTVLWEQVHPEDVAGLQASLEHAAATLSLWDYRWRITTPSGQQKWLYGRGQPYPLPDGGTVWYTLVLDITAHYQREQAFRKLADHSPDCVIRLDREGRYLYVNPATVRLTGIPIQTFLGRTSRELGFPTELLEQWQDIQNFVAQTLEPYVCELVMADANGDPRKLLTSVIPERDPQGNLESFLIIHRDVTDLQQAQERLQCQVERERLLNQLIRSMRQSLHWGEIVPSAMAEMRRILAADRVILYELGPEAEQTVIAESVGTSWIPAVSVHNDLRLPLDWLRTLAAGEKICLNHLPDARELDALERQSFFELEVKAKLGVPVFVGEHLWGVLCVHHCMQPHRWEPWEIELAEQLAEQLGLAVQQSQLYEQVQRLNANLETQVRQKTAALEQAHQFDRLLREITHKLRDNLDEQEILRTVVRELALALDLLCCDTGIYDPTQTSSTITQEYSRLETSCLDCTYSLIEDQGIYFWLKRGIPAQFCLITAGSRTHDGRYLATLACPIRDHEMILGDIWLFREQEATFSEAEVRLVEQVAAQCGIALRQSRLFQAAQHQVQALERLNQLKDDFLSTVSHELRTPMSNITMAIELIQNRLQSLSIQDPPLKRYFQILKTEAKREIQLINDLLEMTRLDAKETPVCIRFVESAVWLEGITRPYCERAREAGITFETDIDPCLPGFYTDPNHLDRILQELLTNACKYTPAGERIRFQCQCQEQRLLISVFNSGVTIPDEEKEKIFERFYRSPNRDPWKYSGTGLGLSLVKKLVELLGGEILLHTGPNWVEFILLLPLRWGSGS